METTVPTNAYVEHSTAYTSSAEEGRSAPSPMEAASTTACEEMKILMPKVVGHEHVWLGHGRFFAVFPNRQSARLLPGCRPRHRYERTAGARTTDARPRKCTTGDSSSGHSSREKSGPPVCHRAGRR